MNHARTSRSWWAWCIAALLLLGVPGVASAHGRLKSTTPGAGAHLGTSPRELRLEFSETPDLTFSAVKLIGPDGRVVALGLLAYAAESHRTVTAAIRQPLQAGTYVVEWQLAGDDGHPVRGRYDFVISPGAMSGTPAADTVAGGMVMHHDPVSMPEGNGFGADSAAYVFVRWVQFLALVLTVGAVWFRQFVLGRIGREGSAYASVRGAAEGRAARIGHAAVVGLAVTLLLRLLAQSYAMHGASDAFNVTLSAQMIAKTTWGMGWLVQLAGVIIAGAGFHMAARMRSFGWRLAALGIVLLALSLALSGHAASAPRLRVIAVVADVLHVLGASGWLGTLAVVLIAGLSPVAGRIDAERGPMVADLIHAFSPVALASAALAAATGTFAAWLHVGTIPNLWSTRYGITLLVKLGVLGIVTMTGFYNWRFVRPRLGTDDATRHLVRSARVEVAVAILVLLVTAVLVASPTSMDATM